jgi:anti-anti-sigma factor
MIHSAAVILMPKRFDYSSSLEFNSAISTTSDLGGNITLDCTDMEYIDSAGIGLLVMAYKSTQSKNISLTLSNLKVAPKEILELANIQKLINIE